MKSFSPTCIFHQHPSPTLEQLFAHFTHITLQHPKSYFWLLTLGTCETASVMILIDFTNFRQNLRVLQNSTMTRFEVL